MLLNAEYNLILSIYKIKYKLQDQFFRFALYASRFASRATTYGISVGRTELGV